MSLGQKVNGAAVKTVSFLWLGSLIAAGFTFVIQVILARSLGVTDFGMFMVAMTIVAVMVPLTVFGVTQFWLKAFGKYGSGARVWMLPTYKFLLLSCTFAAVCYFSWVFLGPNDNNMALLLSIFFLYFLGQLSVELLSGKFQIKGDYQKLFWLQVIPITARLCFVFILCIAIKYADMFFVAYGYAIVAICIFITMVSVFKAEQVGGEDYLKPDAMIGFVPNLKDVFIRVWPFGLIGVFNFIYFQSNIVVVNYIAGAASAGVYSVAVAIISVVYLLPTTVYQRYLLPKLHVWSSHDQEKLAYVLKRTAIVMLVLGLCAMIFIVSLSSWFIPLAFGRDYVDAVRLLNLLAICVPIQFLVSAFGAALLKRKDMSKKVIFMGFACLVNVALSACLVPIYGPLGAVYGTISSSVILLVLYYKASRGILVRGKL